MNPTEPPRSQPSRHGSPPTALAEAAALSSGPLRYGALAAALLVILGVVAGVVPRWLHRHTLLAETRQLALQTVAVILPSPGQTQAGLTLPAEVKALLEAPIYARASGYLKRWLVDIGAQVKEGELLAEIEGPELDQELAQARAQHAQAQAALSLAKTTAARWADLVKSASVSEQEAAEKQADLQLKSATLEAAGANVRRLEEVQRFQKVLAPFSGTVTARKTDQGELIMAGSAKELFRLAQTTTLRIYVRVPQSNARSIQVGQAAEVLIPELPGRPFKATVVRTSGSMSTDSRTLLTELQMDNAKGEILAGCFAQVRFSDLKAVSILTVPANTLLFRAEGPQVGVLDADNKVQLRSVTLGRDFGPTVELLSGLSAKERVILNPSDSLVSGVTVRLAQEPAQTPAAK